MSTNLPSLAIVDDEAELCEVLATMLEDDFQVTKFTNATSAVKSWDESLPVLIVTDLTMPDMTGVQLIEATLAKHPEAKILVMTGYDDEHPDVKKALSSGACGIISKPFRNPSKLVDYVKSFL